MNLASTLRHAARALARRPGFTATAIVVLAVGIGANTALMSLVHGVLLSPLPWREPHRLVAAWEISQRGREMGSAWGNFLDWRRAESLTGLAAYSSGPTTVLGGSEALVAQVSYVSSDFFATLGVAPRVGRLTTAAEHQSDAEPVVVVSQGFFARQLGGDATRLETQRLELDGRICRVVGVVADAMAFPEGTEVWMPVELLAPAPVRSAHNFRLVGRLAADSSLAAAEAELHAMTQAFVSDENKDYLPAGARLRPLSDELRGPVAQPLWMLLGATALLLLVACSNLASSLLARQVERTPELALRSFLGASRSSLVAQPMAESLLLALGGGLLGVALAAILMEYLVALAPPALPRLAQAGLNPIVLAMTPAVTLLTALLFGLAPSLLSLGKGARALRAPASRRQLTGWSWLVGAEVALTLVLMVGAGLLLRTLGTLLAVPLGFSTAGVVTATLDLPAPHFEADGEIAAFHERLLAETSSLPGAVAVAFVSDLPLSGNDRSGHQWVTGGPQPGLDAGYHGVSGDLFRALGQPLVAGRSFTAAERAGSEWVVIVNRTFADQAWPGMDPLGQRVNAAGMDQFFGQEVWATVVGVVADARWRSITSAPQPEAFFPVAQRPQSGTSGALVVATQGRPELMFPALEGRLRNLDDQVPHTLATLEQVAERALAQQRFALRLLGFFAVLALGLSALGIAGVVSYAVARRRRELAVRLALGSAPAAAQRFVVLAFLRVVVAGLVVGLGLALALTRLLGNLLWGVEPTDPLTFSGTLALLLAAAALAAYLPARQVARIPPAEVLREG